MTCSEIRGDLVAFLDGELETRRAETVRAHLAGCVACQAEQDGLIAAWEALDHLPGIDARPGWLEEVEASIVGGEVVPFPTWRRNLTAAAVAAAVALSAGLGYVLSRPVERPDEQQLVLEQPAPRLDVPNEEPREHRLTPREQPEPLPEPVPPEPRQPLPPASKEPELALLDDLSDEELEMLEDLEVVALLEELDELDVLDNLELLEDLDDEELPDDA